jgi:putative hydrolase of the HAD superfamily
MRPAPPRLTSLDAVLFDAGGTLIELDYAFMAERARVHGVALDPHALRRAECVSRREVDRRAQRRGRVEGTDEERRFSYFATLLEGAGVAAGRAGPIAADLEAAHATDNLWRVEVTGAGDTLAAIRARGLTTGVISNADGRVASLLTAVGLAPHLSLILDSHLEGVEKPDPEIFARALARLRLDARRTAYVGDIYAIDALGARAAGLTPVLLDPLGSYPDVDCATIASLAELLG